MDLQTRKIAFIQEFLKLQSEEAIARHEKLLKKEKKINLGKNFKPMAKEALNNRNRILKRIGLKPPPNSYLNINNEFRNNLVMFS